MRALASVLLQKGCRLSGSDPAIRDDDPLTRSGIRCFPAHAAEHVATDTECVIYSTAPFRRPIVNFVGLKNLTFHE